MEVEMETVQAVGQDPTSLEVPTTTTRRGLCRVCNKNTAINTNGGVIRVHTVNEERCRGSRQPPKGSNGQPPLTVREDTPINLITSENLTQAIIATSARTLPHIPKAARPHAATKLSNLLKRVNDAPENIQAWHNVLLFGNVCLTVPPRRDKSLATSVIRAISEYPRGDNLVRLPPRAKHTHRRNGNNNTPETYKIRAQITRKIEEGNTASAIRVLTSDDKIAPRNSATARVLQSQHPPRTQRVDNITPPPADTISDPLTVGESEVYKAALSFPPGSAGGFTGLKPQHIKQMLNPAVGDPAQDLRVELTRFVNACLAGDIPEVIRPLFFGASLCALNKKGGGIRPIAVGNTLRRLVAKAATRVVSQQAAELLKPIQLGFGIPQGCEAAAHAARAYIANMSDEKALLKLDFKNAFNMVRRDAVLCAVHRHFQPLYPFILSCYSGESKLLFGEHEIRSCEGVQQGDPLAPLLFCLVLKEITESLSSEFNIWFLDDGTIAGPPDHLLADIRKIREQEVSLGLFLNPSKCEVVSSNPVIKARIQAALPGAHVIEAVNSTLLGAPLGSNAIEEILDMKITDLRRMENRIGDIDAHDAFYLLTKCLSLPRLTYFLRCAPSYNSPKLEEYDQLLKTMLEKAVNLSLNECQWKQATLPVRLGGLGVRTATQIAVPAFLSSSSASDDLVKEILPDNLCDLAGIQDTHYTECDTKWGTMADPALRPTMPKAKKQSNWDSPIADKEATALLEAATTPSDRARLTAVRAPHAGDFLLAVPMSATGTRLDPQQLRIAVALRLAAPIHTVHRCICGEADADEYGLHGLHCGKSGGWHSRHDEVNDIIKRSLASAQCPAEREPRNLLNHNSAIFAGRPDGITLRPWKGGRQLAWDYTCVSTLATTYVTLSAGQAGAAATQRERHKSTKYRELDHRYNFVPIGSETLGPWGESARRFLKDLGSRLIDTTSDPRAASFLFQRLSVAIQRGNARCILGSCPASEEFEEIYSL